MLRKLLPLLCLLVFAVGCSKDKLVPSETDPISTNQIDPLSKSEINKLISSHTNRGAIFNWSAVNDHVVWSAAMQSDQIFSIGYQPANFENIDELIHEIDLNSNEWSTVKEKIQQEILELEKMEQKNDKLKWEDLQAFDEKTNLPVILAKFTSLEAVKTLRAMDEIRYIEPIGYRMTQTDLRSNEGCGGATPDNINTADYTSTSPGAKIPWNFYNSNIPQAWSKSTGAGIKVALIDTGVSPSQSKLGSEFNSGQSSGRTIEKEGTYVSSWWWWADPDGPDDQCGHGTQMAGLIAAPRSTSGSSVGVAYNCDLLSIRGTGDVVIGSSSELDGVSDALVIAGNDRKVKIISMSLGDIFYHGQVADAIKFAYGKGKLIFAAAGTSTSFTSWVGVTFPATMSQTVAVTGVEDSNNLQKCDVCHSGSEVDFVAVMQRANDDNRTSITLTDSGSQSTYIGGSSTATAMTAGIAALVWSTRPSMKRNKVMDKLKQAASHYPNRTSEYGWGIIDANAAVR